MNIDNKVTLDRIRAESQAFYSDSNPYHNWNHILEVEEYAERFLVRCQRCGVTVDKFVLLASIYLHDAHISVPPNFFFTSGSSPAPITSREMFAAEFARQWLTERFHLPEELVDRVYGTILATHVSVVPQTPEQMLMRAADIANLGGPYDSFGANWERLLEEYPLMTGASISRKEFALKTASFLALYLWLRIELTPRYFNARGASAFHTDALCNITRKVGQECGGTTTILAEVGCGQNPIVFEADYQDEQMVYIGVDTQLSFFPRTFPHIDAKRKTGCPIGPVFLIPGESANLPLHNQMVDRLIYRNAWALIDLFEIVRVLKRDGELIVVESYSPDGSPVSDESARTRIDDLTQGLVAIGMGVTVNDSDLPNSFELRAKFPPTH